MLGESEFEQVHELMELQNLKEKFAPALAVVMRTMQLDKDLAWGWHCNIAMAAQDNGLDRASANRAAAAFMRNAFDTDTTGQMKEWLGI